MSTEQTTTETGGAASARIAAFLREEILHGRFRPGDRIRQEDIAERFGASRLPVREALRMLEAEGLTEHEPNKGARVPRLSQHEVDMIYQMRERLEPLALIESLPVLTTEEHERLEDVQRRIEDNDDVERFLDLDREFHMLTYSGCALDPLNSMVTRMWNSTQHYRRMFVQMGGRSRMWVVNAEHRLILDAVVRRDPTDAERYLQGHIRRTRIELGHHPGRVRGAPVTRVTVNGTEVVLAGDGDTPLLTALRDELGLVGSRFGCGEGLCGACFVRLGDAVVPSCQTPLWQVEGQAVTTVEGLSDEGGPHPVQQAILDRQAAQCGFCVAGIVVRAAALLESEPGADAVRVAEALDRNLCRCGSQQRIVDAITAVSTQQ